MANQSDHGSGDGNDHSAIWRLARRQHGVVSRRQLLEFGLSPSAIYHRVRRGRLHRLGRGIFAVGRPEVDQLGRWMGAVLACGSHALLSHRSAAELWEIRPLGAGPIEVSVPIRAKPRVRGVVVHRRRALASSDRRIHLGIPVTSPARTLIDLASRFTAPRLEAAVSEADKLDLIDPEALAVAIQKMRRQPGTAIMRRLLDRRTFALTDSELERHFLRLVRSSNLPMPETGRDLRGFRADFYWPKLGLVVETDGLRYHRTPSQQNRDRRRDQTFAAAGLTALRFTHSQVRFEAAYVRRTLTEVIQRLMERGPRR
jgi:very-short-patch-repair endonuclease